MIHKFWISPGKKEHDRVANWNQKVEETPDIGNKDPSKRARTHEKEFAEWDSKLACSGTSTVPKMVAFEIKKGDHIGLHFELLKITFFI